MHTISLAVTKKSVTYLADKQNAVERQIALFDLLVLRPDEPMLFHVSSSPTQLINKVLP